MNGDDKVRKANVVFGRSCRLDAPDPGEWSAQLNEQHMCMLCVLRAIESSAC